MSPLIPLQGNPKPAPGAKQDKPKLPEGALKGLNEIERRGVENWWNGKTDDQKRRYLEELDKAKLPKEDRSGSKNSIDIEDFISKDAVKQSKILTDAEDAIKQERARREKEARRRAQKQEPLTLLDVLRLIGGDVIEFSVDLAYMAKGFVKGVAKLPVELAESIKKDALDAINDPTGIKRLIRAITAMKELKEAYDKGSEGCFDTMIREIMPGFSNFFVPPPDVFTNPASRRKWQEDRGEFLGRNAAIFLAPAAMARFIKYLNDFRAVYRMARAAGKTPTEALAFAEKHVVRPAIAPKAPRPFGELIRDAQANPTKWKVVKTEDVPSSNIRNRGGTSRQELLRNVETGEEITRHTLLKPDGSIFEPPHFRPNWK